MDQQQAQPEPFAELESVEKAVIRHASDQKVMLDNSTSLAVAIKLERELRDCPAKYRDELINARLKTPEYSRYFGNGGRGQAGQAAGQGQAAGVNPFKAASDALKAKYGGGQ